MSGDAIYFQCEVNDCNNNEGFLKWLQEFGFDIELPQNEEESNDEENLSSLNEKVEKKKSGQIEAVDN